MKRVFSTALVVILVLAMFSTAYAAIDFNGRQSATYDLSNGKKVRIEYHGGQPHYHELDSKGKDLGSENLNNDGAHHAGSGPSKDTHDIVKGGKQKSQGDKNAKKKADEYKKGWSDAEKSANNSSKSFIEKNKTDIQKAAEKGSAVVIIGGVIYVIWCIIKVASGWGILIPV